MNGLIQTPLSFNSFLPLGTTKTPDSALQRFSDTLQYTAEVAALQSLDTQTSLFTLVPPGAMAGGINGLISFPNDGKIRRLLSFGAFSNAAMGAGVAMSGYLYYQSTLATSLGNGSINKVSEHMAFVAGDFPGWASEITNDEQLLISGPAAAIGIHLSRLTGASHALTVYASYIEWQK